LPIEREDGKTLKEIVLRVIFVIKTKLAMNFILFWSANILKIVGRHILMITIEKDQALLNLKNK